jgi:hypothetical protein
MFKNFPSQHFHGLVLRLIEKEKEVQNLQDEVDRLKGRKVRESVGYFRLCLF